MSENEKTDTTSFASILAGVQMLRREGRISDSSVSIETPIARPTAPIALKEQSRGLKRTNAFNQDRRITNEKPKQQKVAAISVNKSQTGNPLLKSISNVNWSYVESRNLYDYLVNKRFVIFLSLKYHKLHPEYVERKMKPLSKKDAILLTVVDIDNSETILREINKTCLYNEFTLLLAFSFEQAAKYLTFLATTIS